MTGPTREEVERHDHWAVTVSASGEHIITLEPECYGGREPSSADEDAIRTAAHHLLSFIGDDTPAALRERLEAAEAERDAADNALVDRYRDPKSGLFSFPSDVAAIVRRLDAAEAALTEARAREAAAWEAGRDAAARAVHAFARALNWHPSNVTDCVASILRLTPHPPPAERSPADDRYRDHHMERRPDVGPG